MAPRIDQVLVGRLVSWYSPLPPLGLTVGDLEHVDSFAPTIQHAAEDRDAWGVEQHLGRVHYLLRLLRNGGTLEPIEIDNEWFGTTPLYPIVVDGHHRLIAHFIARKRRIAASYSGWTEILKYLKGKRRRRP